MKLRNFVFMGIATLAFFTVGCSNDDGNEVVPVQGNTPGELKIELSEISDVVTRGVPGTDIVDNEKDINNYMVYVFNQSNGLLEKSVLQTVKNNLTTTITGLSTNTSKQVVVLTNIAGNTDFTLADGTAYSVLEALIVKHANQNFNTIHSDKTGMIMFGETPNVPVVATVANTATVNVSRIAAKVTLAELKINPSDAYDISKFKILGISIQRAVTEVTVKGTKATGYTLVGGLAENGTVTSDTHFYDGVDITFNDRNVNALESSYAYYVLPNNGTGVSKDNCTLITLKAQYDNGEPFYYPIPINAVINSSNPDDEQDETFIKSNHNYNVYITIKDITNGATKPEELLERGDLDVTIKIVDWTDIDQYEEW